MIKKYIQNKINKIFFKVESQYKKGNNKNLNDKQ